eukprot:gb/GECG01005630.1/.p1 GENE.gb/GECG01005630.1/~~gb/GECG01005630.1/.p1  ORF type:complete len:446 (+),score=52.53 gb/GECG01005630.1/:1-1338(+)
MMENIVCGKYGLICTVCEAVFDPIPLCLARHLSDSSCPNALSPSSAPLGEFSTENTPGSNAKVYQTAVNWLRNPPGILPESRPKHPGPNLPDPYLPIQEGIQCSMCLKTFRFKKYFDNHNESKHDDEAEYSDIKCQRGPQKRYYWVIPDHDDVAMDIPVPRDTMVPNATNSPKKLEEEPRGIDGESSPTPQTRSEDEDEASEVATPRIAEVDNSMNFMTSEQLQKEAAEAICSLAWAPPQQFELQSRSPEGQDKENENDLITTCTPRTTDPPLHSYMDKECVYSKTRRPEPFSCRMCKRIFATSSGLRTHYRGIHREANMQVSAVIGTFDNGETTFEVQNSANPTSTRRKGSHRWFKCSVCEHIIRTLEGFRSHKRRVHNGEARYIQVERRSGSVPEFVEVEDELGEKDSCYTFSNVGIKRSLMCYEQLQIPIVKAKRSINFASL